MSVDPCCVQGFKWEGQTEGRVEPLPTASNQAYVTGTNAEVAVILVHDLFGWEFANIRLLADHLAREVGATVYVPDFFAGDSLPSDALADVSRWGEIDVRGFVAKNGREIREPEILACTRKLRTQYRKVGAVGYCYGGWAVFRLGAKANDNLVDCIVAGHPSLLTKEDIDGVGVPVQILAPEIDAAFTSELKQHAWTTILGLGVGFDYQHFPGVEHACLVRGDPKIDGEQKAMERGKNAAVAWLREWLR